MQVGAVGELGDLVGVVGGVVLEKRGETHALVFTGRLDDVGAPSDALVGAGAVIGDHHSLVVFVVQRDKLEERLEAEVGSCLLERALLDLAEVDLVKLALDQFLQRIIAQFEVQVLHITRTVLTLHLVGLRPLTRQRLFLAR